MSISLVQKSPVAFSGGGSGTSVTLNGVGQGNMLMIGVASANQITPPTDNNGIVSVAAGAGTVVPCCGIYYVPNAAAGTHTISVSGSYTSLYVAEYSGITTSGSPVDGSMPGQANGASGASLTTASVTPSQPGDLAVAVFAQNYQTQGGASGAISAGWTKQEDDWYSADYPSSLWADWGNIGTGALSCTLTSPDSADPWGAAIALFRSAGGGGTGIPTFISNTPTNQWTGSATTKATNGFTVNAGDLILVLGGDDGWNTGVTRGCNSSGVPCAFTKLFDTGQYPSYCGNFCFWGLAQTAGTMVVNVTFSVQSAYAFSVEVWRNAKIGNYRSPVYTSSGNQTADFTFPTNYNNSGVAFLLDDWNASAATGTWTAGFVQDVYTQDTTDGFTLGIAHNPNIGAAGNYLIGSNMTSSNITMSAVEIAYGGGQSALPGVDFMQVFAMRGSR